MVNEATMTRRELNSRLWEIIRTEGIVVTNQNLDWLLERAWKSAQVTDVPSAETREKQIEEMAKAYYEAMLKASETLGSMNEGAPKWYAKELYAKGYRLASEVAREIIRDIIEPIWDVYKSSPYEDIKLLVALLCESIKCKLENKYMEDENEN